MIAPGPFIAHPASPTPPIPGAIQQDLPTLNTTERIACTSLSLRFPTGRRRRLHQANALASRPRIRQRFRPRESHASRLCIAGHSSPRLFRGLGESGCVSLTRCGVSLTRWLAVVVTARAAALAMIPSVLLINHGD